MLFYIVLYLSLDNCFYRVTVNVSPLLLTDIIVRPRKVIIINAKEGGGRA
jgi:hypothetical protein